MRPLFSLAILSSATLLFMVQPLAGKSLLPVLGGSPAVWSTSLVFFQTALLLGYLYAHLLSTRVAPRWQRHIHLGVLVAASLTLPLPLEIGEPGGAEPGWWVLQTLTVTVGLPLLALSATSPLLQQWFSRTSDSRAKDPYFLYAASNAGSLLGLLGYLVVEPFATRTIQATTWSVAFWVVAAVICGCAYASARQALPRTRGARGTPAPSVTLSRRLLWIGLALVPSALLLGVTQHLATDVVSAPLLWVVPLALYLATFIAAFSRRGFGSAARWGAVAPFAALIVLLLALAEVRYPILLITLAHLAAFTILVMLCHTRLAESRPDPQRLTDYFVCISLGGVLGGAAVALVAPSVFTSILEYPLAIAAALLFRPQSSTADRMAGGSGARWAWRAAALMLLVVAYWVISAFDASPFTSQPGSSALLTRLQSLAGDTESARRVARASLALPTLLLLTPRTALLFAGAAAGLLVGAGVVRTGGEVIARERTFFGVHQVTAVQNGDWHVLTHGTTTHGIQALRGKGRLLPTAYYHPTGPLGDLVFTLSPDGRFRDVAAIGLGAGALAGYAGSGTTITFFEIDDAVIRIAEKPSYFTYLADARARPGAAVRTIAADGRLGLRTMPAGSLDLIVVDAFSSDAIPTHLITREAVSMYTSRLKPRGVLAFHISNRFFNLRPVLARIADDQGLVSYARDDNAVPPERSAEAMRASVWVVLARAEGDLGQLARSAPRWLRLTARPGDSLWTDDYANVLGALAR